MFGELYRLGGEAASETTGELYGCAASGGAGAAAMLTRYADADEAPVKEAVISLCGLSEGARVSWFLLDEQNTMAKVREDRAFGGRLETVVPLKLFDTLLLRVEP